MSLRDIETQIKSESKESFSRLFSEDGSGILSTDLLEGGNLQGLL
jgi:hypothetical protein